MTSTPTESTRPARRGLLRVAGALLAGAVTATLLPLAAAPASAATYPMPKTPRFTTAAESTVPYDPARTCSPSAKPGAVSLKALILATYPNTWDSGISRACTSGGTSEHHEGRAWDWGVRAWDAREAGQAATLLRWLTRNDGEMARRLGVMYVIWDDKMWRAYDRDRGWTAYTHAACRGIKLSKCSNTLRHRDHVHFSFSWGGALKRTSFWSGTSTSRSTTRHTGPLASAMGQTVRPGDRSDAVKVLQKALRMQSVTGYYGAKTQSRVVAFARAKGLRTDGVVTNKMWTALEDRIGYFSGRINEVDHMTLRPGVKRPVAVRILEAALFRAADEYYGGGTKAAVVAFQRNRGLAADGIVGPKTWNALRGL